MPNTRKFKTHGGKSSAAGRKTKTQSAVARDTGVVMENVNTNHLSVVGSKRPKLTLNEYKKRQQNETAVGSDEGHEGPSNSRS